MDFLIIYILMGIGFYMGACAVTPHKFDCDVLSILLGFFFGCFLWPLAFIFQMILKGIDK